MWCDSHNQTRAMRMRRMMCEVYLSTISMTVCRAAAAVELADKRTDKFVIPRFSLNVINDESRAIKRLACQKLISVPTRVGRLASRGRTARCVQTLVTSQVLLRVRKTATNHCASSRILLSLISVLPRSE